MISKKDINVLKAWFSSNFLGYSEYFIESEGWCETCGPDYVQGMTCANVHDALDAFFESKENK